MHEARSEAKEGQRKTQRKREEEEQMERRGISMKEGEW